MQKIKIFGIGFYKTGTSSLAEALTILGYRVTGEFGIHDPNIENNVYDKVLQIIEKYDAFQDNPWPIIYKFLDEKYPESKFILTIRDTDKWLKSVVKHFGNEKTYMRRWIYGVGNPLGNEDIFKSRFEKHNNQVLVYFKHRNNDLLVLDFSKGAGWRELCSFLECEVPEVPFPHKNKASNRRIFNRVYNKLKL
jgi:hypothetical protein